MICGILRQEGAGEVKDIRAGSVQFNHVPGDKAANLQTLRRFTGMAGERGVRLLVFPEMCITGYWHLRRLDRGALEALSESVPEGTSTRELLRLSREYGMTVGAGLIERSEQGRLYNTYVVAMPDGRTVRHRKLHCFISEHMDSGDAYTVFDIPGVGRVGVLTCYDNNIIENVRITALMGAEILLAPHQTGGCVTPSPRCMGAIDPKLWENRDRDPGAVEAEFRGPKGREWLMRWLPARAHDNGMFLIFSNGVGPDDDEVRTGNAMILDPYGEILAETWRADEALVTADLEAGRLEKCTGSRWIKSRRPSLYGVLTVATGAERDTRTLRFTGG
jgi:predicted amidohydrolase